MLKVIHFDSSKSQKDFQYNNDQEYLEVDSLQYLKKNGPFQADIVTGFACSKFNKEFIDSVNGLKLIITRSIGIDNIDIAYCQEKGIRYSNIDYSRYNVAHHTFGLILFYSRQLEDSFDNVQNGNFCHENISCKDLRLMQLGIIGLGKIGKEIAKLAESFGMKVVACDPKYKIGEKIENVPILDFRSVVTSSDIISINCDANASSIGMINSDAIQMMKDNVILINTARGSIIKQDDLIRYVDKFSFIGLDVVDKENEFSQNHILLKYSNIYITPHIAHKSKVTIGERWEHTYEIIKNFEDSIY